MQNLSKWKVRTKQGDGEIVFYARYVRLCDECVTTFNDENFADEDRVQTFYWHQVKSIERVVDGKDAEN